MKVHPHIGMDTMGRRNGLHLWLNGTAMGRSRDDEVLKDASISVHLTREQAQALIDEINRRLF